MSAIALKRCFDCGEEKPLDEFHVRQASRDGRQNRCALCNCARTKRWAADNPEKILARNLARHGLTIADYERMLEGQDGGCAICGVTVARLEVDHDHACCEGEYSCGECIRGLLCFQCNRGLMNFRDSPVALARAIGYLA